MIILCMLFCAVSPASMGSDRSTRTNSLNFGTVATAAIANSEGIPTLDLRQLVISDPKTSFRDSFYQLLRTLQRAGSNPLGLDLSYSHFRRFVEEAALSAKHGRLYDFSSMEKMKASSKEHVAMNTSGIPDRERVSGTQVPPLRMAIASRGMNLSAHSQSTDQKS